MRDQLLIALPKIGTRVTLRRVETTEPCSFACFHCQETRSTDDGYTFYVAPWRDVFCHECAHSLRLPASGVSHE
jgi:hypothetical protein